MKSFPEKIRFKYPWRKYQQRILDEFNIFKADGHLHLIAPPGSGKTVLGLQIALELNQPVLILAPTRAIRDQWVERFRDLFLQVPELPEWISFNIRKPGFFTVATYQGLHAACSNRFENTLEEDDDETTGEESEVATAPPVNLNLKNIVSVLKKAAIKTIIADEAHHLKNEWWHSLFAVKEALAPFIVGLTATPPYDVSYAEWQRYNLLNGPIDAEISVPELIRENDLCPHQDFIHYTLPSPEESQKLDDFKEEANRLMEELKTSSSLISIVEQLPIWTNPLENLEWIYDHTEQYSSCLIFLHHNQHEIPETHKEVIGTKELPIPPLDETWFNALLHFILFDETNWLKPFANEREELEARLKRRGVLEKRTINFLENSRFNQMLSTSVSKLKSIEEIVEFEYRNAGKETRCVILADYIRKEYLTTENENNIPIVKTGVVPVFELLRRTNHNSKKLGVLTGSLIIIPNTAISLLFQLAGKNEVNTQMLPYDGNYSFVEMKEQNGRNDVHLITALFCQGAIEVLIGTKSLLGEGWDAPEINTLILASTVGSFVLSNQMRGRAIRTLKTNPNKTANIWHLACVYPPALNKGADYDALKRRFKGFTGIAYEEAAIIENGIERIHPPTMLSNQEEITEANEASFNYAGKRALLKQQWTAAIDTGTKMAEELMLPFPEKRSYEQTKKLYLFRTIGNLLTTLGIAILTYTKDALFAALKLYKAIATGPGLTIFLSIFSLAGIVIFGRATIKTLKLYIRYRDIGKDLENIAHALLNTLIYIEAIKTPEERLKIIVRKKRNGAVFCHLEGATSMETTVFMNALFELIDPIKNPRYIIIRKSLFLFTVKQRDYHAVPTPLAKHQRIAQYFQKQWRQRVGNCSLIYTRTMEGRKFLLRTRLESLAATIENKPEQTNRWV